jgi:alkyl hydroperoxide reductase subunit F
MLDANTKAQLKAYLEKVVMPIEIDASLDDSDKSAEMLSLLNDINGMSSMVTLREHRDDGHRTPSRSTASAPTWVSVLPVSRWDMNLLR